MFNLPVCNIKSSMKQSRHCHMVTPTTIAEAGALLSLSLHTHTVWASKDIVSVYLPTSGTYLSFVGAYS